jgi:hypothetical protein
MHSTTDYGRSSSLPLVTTAGPGGWHARTSPSSRSTSPPPQEDRRAKAPEGGPVYVAADVTDSPTPGEAGSGLAVDVESGFERQHVLRLLARGYYRRVGETLRFRLRPGDAAAVFSETGWTIDTLLTGSELDKEHLTTTKLAGTLNTSSFVAVAQR